MPADLTREEIECAVHHVALFGHANAPSPVRGLTVGGLLGVLRAAAAHLDEPARLAAARAEGYREGVEAAARWHDDQAERIRCDADPLCTRRLDAIGDHEEAATAIRSLGGHHG